MGILAAEKENLRTDLAQAFNRVREQELRFYSGTMSVIGTEAALLVTLSFSLVASWEPLLPKAGYLPRNISLEWGLNDEEYEHEHGIAGWDWVDWYTQLLQLAYLVMSMYTTIKLLSIVQMCVFAEFRAVGLALRGPDGSLQRAVHKLQRQQEYQVRGLRRSS